MMSNHHQQHPFYFGNNNYHQSFQSDKSKFNTPEDESRWFEAFNYFRAIKPEPLELNPGFQSFQNTPPAHYYQQAYQNGYTTTPPQFYFHTQNIIQNNINNRVQNIFANDATVHQDDNNTLVNLALPGGQVHTSMETRSQLDSYYYSGSTGNRSRHGLNQPPNEKESTAEDSTNINKRKHQEESPETEKANKDLHQDGDSKMLDEESKIQA